MELKDWLTVTLSLLALLISLTTAYFNIILTKDDIRVIASEPILIVDGKGVPAVLGTQQITFFNLGNRSAVVRLVSFIFKKPSEQPSEDRAISQCNEETQQSELGYDFEPFVIEPGKVVIRQFKPEDVHPGYWQTDKIKNAIILNTGGDSYFGKGDIVFTCLKVTVTTPHESIYPILPRSSVTIPEIPYDGIAGKHLLLNPGNPFPVIRKNGTLFSD